MIEIIDMILGVALGISMCGLAICASVFSIVAAKDIIRGWVEK